MSGNFGFVPPSDDGSNNSENEDGNPEDNPHFAEIFKQFSGMGLDIKSLIASLSGSGTAANLSRDVIRDISRKTLSAHGELPVGLTDLNQIHEAFTIADLWVDGATTFPSLGIPENCAMGRGEWIAASLTGWHELAKPLIDGLSEGMANAITTETNAAEMPIPGIGNIAGVMSTFMSSMIATQLGQTIGNLATTLTGANDVALPLLKPARTFLIPQNVAKWSDGLEIPEAEVRIFLALREISAARLFAHTPWLTQYLESTITAYGKGIRIDFSAIQEQAQEALASGELDPANPESISHALTSGMFTPGETQAQSNALAKLEMVLALIEGWIDQVVVDAAGDRLPSLLKLRETQARRRATQSPTQQLFAALVGLEVSPRTARECATFWREIGELKAENRDRLWEDAVLLPEQNDLADPIKFLKSTIVPDDLSGLI